MLDSLSVSRRVQGVVACLPVLYFASLVAWMSDDGLINVRTALNFRVGAGPVFNVGERVQAYTSPLWFWLQTLVGALPQEFIISSLVLSLILSLSAFFLIGFFSLNSTRLLPIFAVLFFSTTLHDYSTGGLENALAMLLVVLFLCQATRPSDEHGRRFSVWIVFLGSLVLLTRLDYAILLVPFVFILFQMPRSRRSLTLSLLGLLPLVVWFSFALSYYGQLLPNTYSAKLNVDIPRTELLVSGIRYLIVSVYLDPVLAMAFLGAVFTALSSGDARFRLALYASLLYIAYVIWIGGDFMAGRFLTTPMIVWLWIIAAAPFKKVHLEGSETSRHRTLFSFSFLIITILLVFPSTVVERPSFKSGPRVDFQSFGGIADEAGFYREQGSSLIGTLLRMKEASGFTDVSGSSEAPSFTQLATLVRRQQMWFRHVPAPPGTERPVVPVCGLMGNTALAVGPSVHIVDTCGLADPFLARITYGAQDFDWRIGHFVRPLPDGYLDAVRFGESSRISDRRQRELLEQVWQQTREG